MTRFNRPGGRNISFVAFPENEGYLLLLQTEAGGPGAIDNLWKGETICMSTLKDDAILRFHVQPEVLLLVGFNAVHMSNRRRDLHDSLGPGLEFRQENRPPSYVVAESIHQLKEAVICLSQTIIDAIKEVEGYLAEFKVLDPVEQAPLLSRWKEVVRHCFKLGFEFHKDVLRLVSCKPDKQIALNVVKLSEEWMKFTVAHCERGRGTRPKWAAQVIFTIQIMLVLKPPFYKSNLFVP